MGATIWPIGSAPARLELDRAELARARAGEAVSSLLFRARSGRLHKAGYAPVRLPPADEPGSASTDAASGAVLALVAVEGSADFLRGGGGPTGVRQGVWRT